MLGPLFEAQRAASSAPLPPFIPLHRPDPGTEGLARAPEPDFPVYVVEADRGLRIALARELAAAGFETRPFADAGDLAAAADELEPGCVVLDLAAIDGEAAPIRDEGGAGPLLYPTILHFSALEPEDAIAAVRAGAADLLPRPLRTAELVAALRRAAPRVAAFAPPLAARRARAAIQGLTRRERDVMDCIMAGLPNKRIAYALGISPRTVEMHRARLHRRLRLGSIAELLALGWLAGSAT
jgi:two-component system response regulator FixJ